MTIVSVRIYFHPLSERRERALTATHWGFAEWFERRLKPIRTQLQGPEVKGVNIANLMLYENPRHVRRPNEWYKRLNTLEYDFHCDLRPLEANLPLSNIRKLMQFYATVARTAPWPQMHAVAQALAAPLTADDEKSLLPYLAWPRSVGLQA
jgi:hypothetical protein